MNADEQIPVPEKVALFFKQGTSDKTYQMQLNAVEGGWMFTAQNGRRGGTLTHRDKTKIPVPYDVAKKAYDKVLKTKTREGYTPNGSGVAYTNTEDAGRVTEYLPQLLNDTTLEEIINYFRTGRPLWMQTKHDGDRRGVLGTDHEVIGANRKGLIVPLQAEIHAACIATTRQCGGILTLDTEDMGDHLVIFDVLRYGDQDLRPQGFGTRAVRLDRVCSTISRHSLGKHLDVDLPVRPNSVKDIVDYVDNAKASNEEGVVFRTNAIYTPGRPNSGGPVLKLKFWESATCRVASIHATKNSIALKLLSENGWIRVGNCTVNHAKHKLKKDDLVEIKYLYAYKGGSLFEPSFKGKRTDLLPVAANLAQLKYKK